MLLFKNKMLINKHRIIDLCKLEDAFEIQKNYTFKLQNTQ